MAASPVKTRWLPEAEAAEPLLSLSRIVKCWPGRGPVLDGVSLTLQPGSVARLSGQNGSGKTTLLRIAAGVLRPDGGHVQVEGLSPKRDRSAFQRRIGYLSA